MAMAVAAAAAAAFGCVAAGAEAIVGNVGVVVGSWAAGLEVGAPPRGGRRRLSDVDEACEGGWLAEWVPTTSGRGASSGASACAVANQVTMVAIGGEAGSLYNNGIIGMCVTKLVISSCKWDP